MNQYRISGFADEIAPDLTTQLEVIGRLGMQHIEMRGVDGDNLINHSDESVKKIKQRLDAAGVTLSALGSPLGKIGVTDECARHLEDCKRAEEIAQRMDCNRIRMFSFYLPEGKTAEYRGEVIERLGQFVDYAKANDVVLLHENEKGIYGEMAAECLDLMKQFYGANFKAIFDFANFVQAGQDTLEAYEMLKPYIAYIHVKDAILENGKVVPAGMGDGNVAKILTDLYHNGFDGYLSLEPHLFGFTGFAALEKDGVSIQDTGKVLSGSEAFTLAHDSLLKILAQI